MPDYVVTHFYRDAIDGETSKQYEGTFADYAAARAAANDLLTDAQALTDAQIYKETLAESTDLPGAPQGTSNVFERIDATVSLSGGNDGNIKVPSPVAAAFSGNSLIIGTGVWPDFTANFAAGLWTVSDGESITGTRRGRRVFVRSGRTNLPA